MITHIWFDIYGDHMWYQPFLRLEDIWATIYGLSYMDKNCLDNHIWESYVDEAHVRSYMGDHIWIDCEHIWMNRLPYMVYRI